MTQEPNGICDRCFEPKRMYVEAADGRLFCRECYDALQATATPRPEEQS